MLSKYLYLQSRLNKYHMEKYFKSSVSIFRLSILILSKPASLLCFVDPSLIILNRHKVVHRFPPRSTDGRSTG